MLGIAIALTERLLGFVSTQQRGEGGAEGRWCQGGVGEAGGTAVVAWGVLADDQPAFG